MTPFNRPRESPVLPRHHRRSTLIALVPSPAVPLSQAPTISPPFSTAELHRLLHRRLINLNLPDDQHMVYAEGVAAFMTNSTSFLMKLQLLTHPRIEAFLKGNRLLSIVFHILTLSQLQPLRLLQRPLFRAVRPLQWLLAPFAAMSMPLFVRISLLQLFPFRMLHRRRIAQAAPPQTLRRPRFVEDAVTTVHHVRDRALDAANRFADAIRAGPPAPPWPTLPTWPSALMETHAGARTAESTTTVDSTETMDNTETTDSADTSGSPEVSISTPLSQSSPGNLLSEGNKIEGVDGDGDDLETDSEHLPHWQLPHFPAPPHWPAPPSWPASSEETPVERAEEAMNSADAVNKVEKFDVSEVKVEESTHVDESTVVVDSLGANLVKEKEGSSEKNEESMSVDMGAESVTDVEIATPISRTPVISIAGSVDEERDSDSFSLSSSVDGSPGYRQRVIRSRIKALQLRREQVNGLRGLTLDGDELGAELNGISRSPKR